MNYKFQIENNPSQEDLALISNGLTEHSAPFTNNSEAFVKITLMMRDENDKVFGGAAGLIAWNWFYVSHLWVDSSVRGNGLGKEIMTRFEDAARKRGCEKAHLDTFSFQAKPFYESLGYKVFAELDDYPKGHKKFFMCKDL